MNIGVPGKTNHDFDNEFDEDSGLITGSENRIHIQNNRRFIGSSIKANAAFLRTIG
jgi:hypothetical protein